MKNLAVVSYLLVLFAYVNPGFSKQNKAFFENELTKKVTKEISIRYLIHLSENYDSSKDHLPLLIYLHGGLGKGVIFKNCIGIQFLI